MRNAWVAVVVAMVLVPALSGNQAPARRVAITIDDGPVEVAPLIMDWIHT